MIMKKKYLMMRLRTQCLNNNSNTFIHIFNITFHHLQLTQVSRLYTTMTQTTSLTTHNMFPVYHLTPNLTRGGGNTNKYHPYCKFTTRYCIKLPCFHWHQYVHLHNTHNVKIINGAHLYPPPISDHHNLLHLEKFHGPTHLQVNSCDNPNKSL